MIRMASHVFRFLHTARIQDIGNGNAEENFEILRQQDKLGFAVLASHGFEVARVLSDLSDLDKSVCRLLHDLSKIQKVFDKIHIRSGDTNKYSSGTTPSERTKHLMELEEAQSLFDNCRELGSQGSDGIAENHMEEILKSILEFMRREGMVREPFRRNGVDELQFDERSYAKIDRRKSLDGSLIPLRPEHRNSTELDRRHAHIFEMDVELSVHAITAMVDFISLAKICQGDLSRIPQQLARKNKLHNYFSETETVGLITNFSTCRAQIKEISRSLQEQILHEDHIISDTCGKHLGDSLTLGDTNIVSRFQENVLTALRNTRLWPSTLFDQSHEGEQ